MKTPGRNIFILASVCLCVVIISIVVKEKSARTTLVESRLGIFATTSTSTIGDIRDLVSKDNFDNAFATTTNPFAPDSSDTMTDSLSKELFLSYIQYDNQGLLDNSAQGGADQIAEKVISNIDTNKLPHTTYAFNQISTFTPKILGDLYTYGNAYAKAEVGNLSVVRQNPKLYKDNLGAIATVYQKVSEDMMKIKTPLVIAINHLAIANDYKLMADSLTNIDQSKTDPLKATLSMKIFRESLKNQSENYLEIASYLQENDIIFPENAPGFIFNKPKTKSATSI